MEENNSKKLLILIDTNVGGKGGAETHLWNLLSGIDKSRYSVDVIYFDADEADLNSVRENIDQVNYYRIPVRKVFSVSSVKYLIKIFRIMKSGKYDCVISFFESSDIITALLGSLAGIKMRISNRRDTGFRNSKKLEFVYRIINRLFTHFIVVSLAVKESIISQGVNSDKVEVIYNAVNIKHFINSNGSAVRKETGIGNDEIVFGMVANLNPVKNHQSVIEALNQLHIKGKKAHLIFAGDGELRNDLEQKTENLGLKSYVHFLGARNDIENVLDALDIFILASHTEGLSNALLEAMASKKAVIATRVGGNIEVVVDGVDGMLVSTESVSIAKAMNKLFDSERLRTDMGIKAFEHITRQFSLELMLNSYMNLIDYPGQNFELKGHTTSSTS